MSGMTGGSMLRTRKKDANVKPNRRLDRKSSRGMLYENEELRLRTININAEVERGQSDIKKLKRENEQLRREVGALRGEYDRLERLLKARHMEELSDAEGSGSCCSDCESECCNIQNDANAACDNKEEFLMCCQNDAPVGFKVNEGYPKDFISHSVTSSFESCGTLSAVPEEPMTPQPCSQTKGLQACNCQMLSNDLDNEKSAPMPNDNNQEFFTAVVTVPLASHLPKPTDVHPTAIFPKAGLDILINNNAFEKFEGFTISPPIGFILPPSPNCNQSNDENYQVVPKVDLTDDNQHNFTVNDITPINNQSEQPNYNISSQNTYNGENLFPTDGNLDDFLKCVDTFADKDNMNSVKDSFFVCNTRKVIQKLTVHNSSNLNNSVNKIKYNPNEEETLADFNDEEINPNAENKQSFRTEKNIELNYDYPRKPVGKREQKIFIEPIDKHEQTICTDITETTHTTTEINSTLLLFERKNLDNKGHKRGEKFERSHSAPVEPFVDEPIYATVKKLPNKLKRLHIKKLENEVTYIPPEEKSIEEKKNSDFGAESSTNIPSILKIPDLELSDSTLKNNGIPKTRLKLDSLSESSEKIEINHDANIIPKSPIARKKKRFSIHFKRKGNKKPPPSKSIDNPEPSVEVVENQVDKNKPDEGKIDSDRLLEQSSSLDIPDTVRFKDNGNNYTCRKHSRQLKSNVPHNCTKSRQCLNCECSKVHHCERCLGHRKYSLKDHEHNKKRHSPVRHYFKHDSYQEITTSHSERERTNSLSSSAHSGFSLATNKSRKMSVTHREGSIPWCGCWGNSCL